MRVSNIRLEGELATVPAEELRAPSPECADVSQEQDLGHLTGRSNFRGYAGIPAAGRSAQRPGSADGRECAVPPARGADPASPDWFKARVGGGDRIPPHGGCIDPLYLFCCGVLWHKRADTGAGWELIHGLRSSGREARASSCALLAKTEAARELLSDLSP